MQLFGRFDDYTALAGSIQGQPGVISDVWFQAGRLIPAMLGRWMLEWPRGIDFLVWVRLLGIALIALTALILSHWVLRQLNGDRKPILLVLSYSAGVLTAALPSLVSAAMWATMTPQLLGLVTAIGAGYWISINSGRCMVRLFVLAAVLILLSAFSYQSLTILALLLPYLGAGISLARGERVRWLPLVMVTSWVALALVLNYVWVITQGGSGSERFGAASYGEASRWMTSEFVPVATNLWVSTDPLFVVGSGIVLSAFLLSPMLLQIRAIWIPAFSLVGICAWLGVILLIRETYVTYRFAMSTQIWLWFSAFFCLSLFVSWAVARRREMQRPLSVFVMLLALGAVVSTHETARSSIADPNERDWLYALCLVDRLEKPETPRMISLVTTKSSQVDSPHKRFDEIGVVSSEVAWSLAPMLRTALFERELDQELVSRLEILEDRVGNLGEASASVNYPACQ